ncbi:5-oxoprolinase (ATP-hydrolyzing), partial [Tremellales sp. Uapishka_1]
MPVAIKTDSKIKIAIDRGGTFTDCVAIPEDGPSFLVKLLSVDPGNYKDAPTEGIRRIMEKFTGRSISRDSLIDTSRISHILMGTTVATNALLERKGERCALLVTKGFKDLLQIGDQTRPRLFDLHIKKAEVLYEQVLEVEERVTIESRDSIDTDALVSPEGDAYVRGLSGDKIRVMQDLDVPHVKGLLEKLQAEGFTSIAVCLLHSFTFQKHELQIEELAKEMGFAQVSVSSQLQPMIKVVPRGTSATADAYLTPGIQKYISSFSSGFKGGFKDPTGTMVAFMQSDGTLAGIHSFSGLKAILSGPAGGVVGYAQTCYDPEEGSPVVGFDMGGTSTDVSRYGGHLEHVFETRTAGITIQSPQLDINTVAAGGGSILFWRNGMFVVGPESASAHPGPACYRKGGPLTVTDANLFLGRLHAASFPSIFGPKENEPLDYEASRKLFVELTDTINKEVEVPKTPEEVAAGFLKVANENMARPIRALTESRGYRTSAHHLSCFGGAGGQHACAIANNLGIHSVLVHKYSSVLSAYGIALAKIGTDLSEPCVEKLNVDTLPAILERAESLKKKATERLLAQGVAQNNITHEVFLNLRYQGTDTSLMIRQPEDGDFEAAFEDRHKREFSFISKDKHLFIDDIRVTGTGQGEKVDPVAWSTELASLRKSPITATSDRETQVYFEEANGFATSKIYTLGDLSPGDVVQGPAIILDETQTIVIFPANEATILKDLIYIDVGLGARTQLTVGVVEPIALSIFGNRFMAIAEQMGRVLQKCAVSLQIKERLDFSCAIFSADGSLVANAPHVPVHLGSMQYAVRGQADLHRGQLRPGDVLVSNHPKMGGTHLPDITVICPVFHEEDGVSNLVFYVAARAHHNDIGGLHGNSMPPESEELWQEGALIYSAFLVRDGVFNHEEITRYLTEPGQYPNVHPAARIQDNISDLKAQVAACTVGTQQIKALFDEYGQAITLFYMEAIRNNAEQVVRSFFKRLAASRPGENLTAVDHMDDGSAIALTVTLDGETGDAIFDFEGTGTSIHGNINAPKAVSNAAITYCIRCMIGTDMPLNAGVLAPIDLRIPYNTLLNPSPGVAVSSGNTEVSQRVTDVIFKAFEATAASQGCMNVVTFVRDNGPGFGETVCGGSGAGPTWKGTSGVHVNMTNTRITDTEILEKIQPVVLRKFQLREGSGGVGRNAGGDGVIREFEFSEAMRVAIIGERRVTQPYGMKGGGPGQRGAFYLSRLGEDGEYATVKTKPSCSMIVKAGDRVILHTPGGGAWGSPDEKPELNTASDILKYNELSGFVPRANGSWAAFTAAQSASN